MKDGFYGEGEVIQYRGLWYVRRDGSWQLMTSDEVALHLTSKGTAQ